MHIRDVVNIPLLDSLEQSAYDMRLRATMPGGEDPRIVIIDLDESSLKEFGWPWDRDRMALLIHTLFEKYGVETLGLDMVLAEPDIDRGLEEIRGLFDSAEITDPRLEEILKRPSRDELLAAIIQRYNVVLGYAFGLEKDVSNTGELPLPIFLEDETAAHTLAPIAARYTASLPVLQADNPAGYFSLIQNTDDDGIIRKVSLINLYEGNAYESLALSIARNYLGTEPAPIFANDVSGFLEAIDVGFNTITVDRKASVYVPYRGGPRSFRYVSAADVLNQSVTKPEDLSGIIAILGTSANGLVDLRATPVAGVFPGVEVHANVVASILDGVFKKRPDWANGMELISVGIIGLLLIFILPRLTAVAMTVVSILTIIGVMSVNMFLWIKLSFVMPVATTLVVVVGLYLLNVIYGFVKETRSRLALKQSFGLYVPPEIVDEMSASEEQVSLNSEKRDMTVLFTDVRDFTTISESLDPETLSELMNAFLTPMTRVVHDYRGAIDKYMGDAMMAFWGAPLRDEKHAKNCLDAAMEMVRQIRILNEDFAIRKWPEIKIGIGLSTGSMSVGNMGSEFRVAYTVLGDTVNLGARLEGLTKQYGVEIIVSEVTRHAVEGYCYRELDRVRVKGKNKPITIYEPIATDEDVTIQQLEALKNMEQGLNFYQQQNWAQALETFQLLHSDEEHKLYQIYIDRITHFQKNPPGKDWDGVYTFSTK